VYENLMVDVRPNSEKLIERAKGIVMMLTGLNYADASRVYDASGRHVKVAVVMERLQIDADSARKRITDADGFLARALGEQR
jgi:N-acetylmuramic acid 6-phosphate etherase